MKRDTVGAQDSGTSKTAVLVGNPNVGKSVLFKNLTDHYVNVSNFPGTTVEIVRARASFDGRRRRLLRSVFRRPDQTGHRPER